MSEPPTRNHDPTEGSMRPAPNRIALFGTSSDLDGVVVALRQRGSQVALVSDPESLALDVGKEHTDCAVFDLREGAATERALTWYCHNVSRVVLVVTDLDDVDARLRALQVGAADHVVAPFATREIVTRIELLAARQRLMRSSLLGAGSVVVDLEGRRVLRGRVSIPLTPRELDVLVVLMRNRSRAVSKNELLELVWDGSTRTANVVEVTVSSLRRKLHEHGPAVIHTVHRVGYAFRPDVPPRASSRSTLVAERDRLVRERDDVIARRDEMIMKLRGELRREAPGSGR